MFRQTLLYLSSSPSVRRIVAENQASRKVAQRFVAGDTLEEAISCAWQLNREGLTVSLDYLGEAVSSREEAAAAADMAIRSLERIANHEIDGNISIKPSQVGLDIDEEFCFQTVRRILDAASAASRSDGEIFVRLDMESSDYTERTIALVERLWEAGYRNVGTVLQSYMRRTIKDVRRLNALGSRVRIVKGAYREPPEVAYQAKRRVDQVFVEAMKLLLSEGHYPAIATHDEDMILATRHYAFEQSIPRDSFEFQMLYGIRRDLQKRLVEEGFNVRIYLPYGDSWYPYLMRRMAERPANLLFLTGNVLKESPASRILKPGILTAGAITGVLTALALKGRGDENGR